MTHFKKISIHFVSTNNFDNLPPPCNGGVSRGRSVAVGCWHFPGTSTALQRHFRGNTKKIYFLFISQKSQCLPYAEVLIIILAYFFYWAYVAKTEEKNQLTEFYKMFR